MKNRGNRLYAIVSLLMVLMVVVLENTHVFLQQYYSRSMQFPITSILLALFKPVICSILLYLKILLQRDIKKSFSIRIEIVSMVLFISCIILFYGPLSLLLNVVSLYPVTAFVLCLQLCFLIHNIFFKNENS